MLEVLEPGPLTTVQNAGRFRASHLGISAGGAADPVSWQIGNRLVGNASAEAALEMTLKGGTFRFLKNTSFALTGSECSSLLDGKPVACWRTWAAQAGQELRVGMSREGARAYLTVHGGFLLPQSLMGQKLMRGDKLPFGSAETPVPLLQCSYRFPWTPNVELRALRGVDWECFPETLRAEFAKASFEVSPYSNRNGIRLKGQLAAGTGPGERITEGVLWGTVQLPPSGEPMILMNDQQTTGGYPQLAQVIQADRALLGQLKPGQRVKFIFVDVDDALEALREQARLIDTGLEPL